MSICLAGFHIHIKTCYCTMMRWSSGTELIIKSSMDSILEYQISLDFFNTFALLSILLEF